ncbi:MAG: hypothetical protein OEZ36_03490 [Spirochaetota bacterium]|nr:hypothetical protein [Spirochaetota bacterium]
MRIDPPTNRGAIIYDHEYRIVVTPDQIHIYKSDDKSLHSLGTLPKLKQSPMDFSVNELLGHVHQWLSRN